VSQETPNGGGASRGGGSVGPRGVGVWLWGLVGGVWQAGVTRICRAAGRAFLFLGNVGKGVVVSVVCWGGSVYGQRLLGGRRGAGTRLRRDAPRRRVAAGGLSLPARAAVLRQRGLE